MIRGNPRHPTGVYEVTVPDPYYTLECLFRGPNALTTLNLLCRLLHYEQIRRIKGFEDIVKQSSYVYCSIYMANWTVYTPSLYRISIDSSPQWFQTRVAPKGTGLLKYILKYFLLPWITMSVRSKACRLAKSLCAYLPAKKSHVRGYKSPFKPSRGSEWKALLAGKMDMNPCNSRLVKRF